MKTLISIAPYLLAGVLSAVSSASLAAPGWTDAGQIISMNQHPPVGPGANAIFIEVSVTTNPSDAAACYTRNGFYFSVNDDRRKRLFATLLAAQLSSRTIQVYVTGNCHAWGHAELDGLIVQ